TVQRHHLRPSRRAARRNRPGLGSPLQRSGARRFDLPAQRRPRPPFDQQQAKQIVNAVENSAPADHGLPGHNWTLKKLKQRVFRTFGRGAGCNGLRRVLREAGLTWKKVKKLLGKAKPEKRAAHIQELLLLFAGVCGGDILLIYVDEVHIHRDLDLGYTWGRKGQRLWR